MMTAYEPGLDRILRDFHAQDKDSLGALSIWIYTLGYCTGSLIVAPVSEIYGRIWLLRVAYLVFTLTLVGCGASQCIGAFIAFRAIMGFAGIVFLARCSHCARHYAKGEEGDIVRCNVDRGWSGTFTFLPFTSSFYPFSIKRDIPVAEHQMTRWR